MNLSRWALGACVLLLLSSASGNPPKEYRIWTTESEYDGGFQFLTLLAEEFGEMQNPKVKFIVKNLDTEELREDFINASRVGGAPDLLWTVNDHIGPFVKADLIVPAEGLAGIDLSAFDESTLRGTKMKNAEGVEKVWGVPVSNGNHLLLLYNKDMVPFPPQNTDEMIAMARENTFDDNFGLVYNQVEPFWLVPWLGGFGGKVFAADGVTPTLDTPEMVATLQFLADLKFKYGIVPPESDYNAMDTLFKQENAAMIINGDWSLTDYQQHLGERLGVARLPMVQATGKWPAPYTAGKSILFPKIRSQDPAPRALLAKFVQYVTTLENQRMMTLYLNRLPVTKTALAQRPYLEDSPENQVQNALLNASADQLSLGTPLPTGPEMRFIWDSMRPMMADVLVGRKTPSEAARVMQRLAKQDIDRSKRQ